MEHFAPRDFDGLQDAIAEFHEKLPGWWFSVGHCSVSNDASCGPDRSFIAEPILSRYDDGFHADLPAPATLADALRDVTAQALKALSV